MRGALKALDSCLGVSPTSLSEEGALALFVQAKEIREESRSLRSRGGEGLLQSMVVAILVLGNEEGALALYAEAKEIQEEGKNYAQKVKGNPKAKVSPVSYTHLRAHET